MKSNSLIKMTEWDGWFKVRTNGRHHVFKHNQKSGLVVVPHPKKDVPVGTAKSILKQAGIK